METAAKMPPRSSLRKRKAVEEPEAVAEVAAPEKKRKGAKAKVEESKVEEVESVEEPEGEKLPEDANETIYINNLNEDVKVEGEPLRFCVPRFLNVADKYCLL